MERAIALSVFILSIILLILSITKWIEHGNLVVSAAVVLAGQWLVWQALASSSDDSWAPPFALQFTLAIFTLIMLIMADSSQVSTQAPQTMELVSPATEAEAGVAAT